MAKKNNSNDLSARLAELDEEFGTSPSLEEPQPQPRVEEPSNKPKKEPVENNGISHSFETEAEEPTPPAKAKEKKGIFGFGKKKKDSTVNTEPAVENIAEEYDVPNELPVQPPSKKRIFGKKGKEELSENQIPTPSPVPVPIPTQSIEDEYEQQEELQSEQEYHIEETFEEQYLEENVENYPIEEVTSDEFEQVHTVSEIPQQDYQEDLPEDKNIFVSPPNLVKQEEVIQEEDSFRPPYSEEEELTPPPIEDEVTEETEKNNDFLGKLQTKKQKKQPKEKPPTDPNKKKAPLLNLFLIALISIIGLILAITLISKLFAKDDTAEISVSSSEFETAEQISVQKAKELIEESNTVDEIVGVEEGEEITFEGGEGFAANENPSSNSTGLVSFREEEVQVNSNGLVSYSNARFGTSFEHPPEWTELSGFTAKETAENVSNVVMVGYPAEAEVIENMRISLEGTPVSVSSKEYFSKTEGLMEQTFNKFTLIKQGETTASGSEAPYRIYQWIPTSEDEQHTYDKNKMKVKQYQVYIAGKQKVYVVTFTAEASVFDKNFDKYNQILSTLSLQR